MIQGYGFIFNEYFQKSVICLFDNLIFFSNVRVSIDQSGRFLRCSLIREHELSFPNLQLDVENLNNIC